MIAPLLLSQVAAQTSASLAAKLIGEDAAFVRVTTDSRQLQPGDLFVALRGDRFDGHDFLAKAVAAGAIALVVERVDLTLAVPQLVVSDTLLALGQIASLNRQNFNGRLLAITGSSGKTTVKTMVAAILAECGSVLMTQGNFNNHIGVPLTLLKIDAPHEFAVIEMGASAIGEIAYLCELAKPDVTLINNVMPAHIQGFGSLEGVSQAKSEIYLGLNQAGTAVVNIDDIFSGDWLALLSDKKIITVSLASDDANFFARDIHYGAETVSFTLVADNNAIAVQLNALGEHSVRNALAAAACAFSVGAELEHIQAGLAQFAPVKGRMSRHLGCGGALIVDDSYNANPGSVRAAIDVLSAQKLQSVLVLGDMGELGEQAAELHADIGRYAQTQGVTKLFTIGTLTRYASDAFGVTAQHYTNQAELIVALKEIANPQTIILIKGSRSAKTDIIVRALCEDLGNPLGDHH